MILGMSVATFTLLHVLISLLAIVAGLIVTGGLLSGHSMPRWTALFLWTTIATSVTGFFFPFHTLMPAHIVGIVSLVVLALAFFARYSKRMEGRWRSIYVVSSIVALYLNVFVLIVQSFQKAPALHALAPKGNEPPFAVTQLVVLVLFVIVGIRATGRFRNAQLQAA